MPTRNAGHIAAEVNKGAKSVTFLPYNFDSSLLTDEKRAEYEKFLKDSGQPIPETVTDSDAEKTKTKVKRG